MTQMHPLHLLRAVSVAELMSLGLLLQDPDGAYIRRWVPELAGLPNKYLIAPWEAPPAKLAAVGVHLGHNYPHRIIATPMQVIH